MIAAISILLIPFAIVGLGVVLKMVLMGGQR